MGLKTALLLVAVVVGGLALVEAGRGGCECTSTGIQCWGAGSGRDLRACLRWLVKRVGAEVARSMCEKHFKPARCTKAMGVVKKVLEKASQVLTSAVNSGLSSAAIAGIILAALVLLALSAAALFPVIKKRRLRRQTLCSPTHSTLPPLPSPPSSSPSSVSPLPAPMEPSLLY